MSTHDQLTIGGGSVLVDDETGHEVKQSDTEILAATRWNTNGDLIADVFRLGMLDDSWNIFDPTYGDGVFWSVHRPPLLIAYVNRRWRAGDPTNVIYQEDFDFRDLPYGDNTFDATVCDPPYVAMGGRDTSTVDYTEDRYGMHDAPGTPKEVQQLGDDLLTEAVRVTRPSARQKDGPGIILYKTQNYVSSGRWFPSVFNTIEHAKKLKLRVVAEFSMIDHYRPQPADRKQWHPHNNMSTLLVFRMPTDRKFKR